MKYIFLMLLWALCLALMINDYIERPPLSGELGDRINNVQGSLWKYGVYATVELLAMLVVMYRYQRFSRYIKIALLLIGMIAFGASIVDAMFGGGVPSIHVVWLAAAIVYVVLYGLFFATRKLKV